MMRWGSRLLGDCYSAFFCTTGFIYGLAVYLKAWNIFNAEGIVALLLRVSSYVLVLAAALDYAMQPLTLKGTPLLSS